MNKKALRTILLILIIPLIAEVFFFNLRFWESLFFKEVADYSITREANNIEVAGIDAPVRNIRIDYPDGQNTGKACHLQITISDEANTDLELPVTEVVPAVEESRYIRIYPDGNVKDIKISFDVNEVPDASGFGVKLNSARPFFIHVTRVVFIAVLMALILLFRPGSEIYKMPLCGSDNKIYDRNKIYVLLGISALVCLWMLIVYAFNVFFPYFFFWNRINI